MAIISPDTIYVVKENDFHVIVGGEQGLVREMAEYFTFEVPGARYMPKYRSGIWDGKIRLLDTRSGRLYTGLVPNLENFANSRGYKVIKTGFGDIENDEHLLIKLNKYIKDLNLHANGQKIEVRDYQLRGVIESITNQRNILVSPTASGKSLIAYILIRYLMLQPEFKNKKILLIVPTTSLVEQMYTDFADYSSENRWNVEDFCHRIYSGKEKSTNKPVIISTWQSIYKFPKAWFEKINLVIGDEAHTFQATSLTSIMSKLTDCPYRVGMTGTLQDSKVHHLVLEGLFGKIINVVTTRELIDRKQISDILIKCIMLNYDPTLAQTLKGMSYIQEIEFLLAHKPRNEFIRNLVVCTKGNTLVLFNRIEHGKLLHEMITKAVPKSRKVFLIFGKTEVMEREDIRAITENEENAIIVASFGTFSQGINIRRLHNYVYAAPVKSIIRNKQSIGRTLRKGENKTRATGYDIGDNLSHKTHKNFSLKHFLYRLKVYQDEKFELRMYNFTI